MPDLKATVHACRACGHVQGLLEPGEACVHCGASGPSNWTSHDGAPRQKALMPQGRPL